MKNLDLIFNQLKINIDKLVKIEVWDNGCLVTINGNLDDVIPYRAIIVNGRRFSFLSKDVSIKKISLEDGNVLYFNSKLSAKNNYSEKAYKELYEDDSDRLSIACKKFAAILYNSSFCLKNDKSKYFISCAEKSLLDYDKLEVYYIAASWMKDLSKGIDYKLFYRFDDVINDLDLFCNVSALILNFSVFSKEYNEVLATFRQKNKNGLTN